MSILAGPNAILLQPDTGLLSSGVQYGSVPFFVSGLANAEANSISILVQSSPVQSPSHAPISPRTGHPSDPPVRFVIINHSSSSSFSYRAAFLSSPHTLPPSLGLARNARLGSVLIPNVCAWDSRACLCRYAFPEAALERDGQLAPTISLPNEHVLGHNCS